MADSTPEFLSTLSLHEAIGVIQRYNSGHLGTALVGQLIGLISGRALSGENLIGAQIDEVSQNQHRVNQLNKCLNVYGVGVRIISLGNIQIRGGTSEMQRIVPIIMNDSKFEAFISQDNDESKVIARLMADCIMQYGVKIFFEIYPREVSKVEVDDFLMDIASQVSQMQSIPEVLREINLRYTNGELLGFVSLERSFGDLEIILSKFLGSIESKEFYDFSIITSTFEDAIAVLEWVQENVPSIFEEYKLKLKQYFMRYCKLRMRVDPSCPYLLTGKSFPNRMETNAIDLLILMRGINDLFPDIIDKQELWSVLVEKDT